MFQIKYIETILEDNWGIVGPKIFQLDSLVLCVGESLILKQYRNYEELQCYIKTYQHIFNKCTKIPKIIKTKNDSFYYEEDGVFYLLMAKIVGNDNFVVSQMDTYEYGRKIANYQRLFTQTNIFKKWDFLDEFENNSRSIMVKSDWKYIDEETYNHLSEQLRVYYNELSVGIVHQDVHLGNFLFSNKKFLGYIDFGMTSQSVLIYDICYAAFNYFRILHGILDDEFILNGILEMVAGFSQKIQLKSTDRDCMIPLMDSIALYMIAYYFEIEAWDGIVLAQKIHHFLSMYNNVLKEGIDKVFYVSSL